MTPRRIQRSRAKGWRMPEGAVYVGRPSRWGNPFRIGECAYMWLGTTDLAYPIATSREPGEYPYQLRVEIPTDPAVVVQWFRAWYSDTMADRPYYGVADLRGHDLVCWCPEPCGEMVALYGVESGDLYEPCAKPRGHTGYHDPSVAPWCHADVLLELANGSGLCDATCSDGWTCTRLPNHEGAHQ